MTTLYVATLARYVLVEAANEQEARTRGQAALSDRYAALREGLGREVPVEIRIVRPTTDEEIELMRWHNEMVSTTG
ncbi:MAG: hypothetical protein KDA80_06895 [Planctomycetaceae bacterium]|nr:hypothetical protein [Planctomycetaceae bacterium]